MNGRKRERRRRKRAARQARYFAIFVRELHRRLYEAMTERGVL